MIPNEHTRDWLDESALFDFATGLIARCEPAIVVRIRAVAGSTPRELDAVMVVSSSMACGTVGGGHLELEAIRRARERLTRPVHGNPLALSRRIATETHRFALGPSLGQCCGGAVELVFEPLTVAHLEVFERLRRPLFRLKLFGAGHVGRALIRALAHVPCLVDWIDERESEFPLAIPHNVRVVAVDAVAAEVSRSAKGDYFLVMTHSHALDLEIVSAVLARGDFGYLGLIGSRTKRVSFERRLRERQLEPEHMHCPIGLPGLRGKQPYVVALSVATDLVQRTITAV